MDRLIKKDFRFTTAATVLCLVLIGFFQNNVCSQVITQRGTIQDIEQQGKIYVNKNSIKYPFNNRQLSISKLATGSYIINIETDKGKFSKSIIKN